MNNMALKRWLVLGGLLALTLYLVWNSPQPEIRLASAPASTRAASIALNQTSITAPMSLDYRLVPRAQAVDEVVDLFAPAVVKRPQVDVNPVVKQVAPAPQAPPLPFTFVGKITEGDGVKIFLQADNVLYSPKVGEIFAQQYKLAGAENGKLSLIYLPLNITQTMFYGETP
jgi:hypothetical protein